MKFLNIEIDEGTTFSFTEFYLDPITGLPVDLSSYSAKLSVTPVQSQPPMLNLSSYTSGIVLGRVPGSIDVKFTPELTKGLFWSGVPYDLTLTKLSGEVAKVLKGLFSVLPSESA